MKPRFLPSPPRLWVLALAIYIVLLLFPISNRLTRLSEVALFLLLWIGAIALCWQSRTLRTGLLIISFLCIGFLLLPGRSPLPVAQLRTEYADGMQRYSDVAYVWGGENFLGIDCSGLVRQGLIDSLLLRGVVSLDPGLVRLAGSLWWNDCSARALIEADPARTQRLFENPSINSLDHSKLLPGDLAVTTSGVHVLGYLGGNRWIQADPGVGKVHTLKAPDADNIWMRTPVILVRWPILASPEE